jgi:hypothetical protein
MPDGEIEVVQWRGDREPAADELLYPLYCVGREQPMYLGEERELHLLRIIPEPWP